MVRFGTVTPFAPGTPVITAAGAHGTIARRCPCSSPLLHYEVSLVEKDHVIIFGHDEIKALLSPSGSSGYPSSPGSAR